MKKVLLFASVFLISIIVISQTNLSGIYGYSFKPRTNTGNDKDATGPKGRLVLQKMENNLYRFWLDVTIGWPSYYVGETDGTINFVNDTASFDNTFEDAEHPCILKFQVSNKIITINSQSSSFNCGFGNGVHADGEYTFEKVQPTLNNAWLEKEYYSSPTIEVIKNKAQVYSDENCLYPKSNYFIKGDNLLSIAENKTSIYTEFFTQEGKFIYGWMKKSDVKVKPSK